MKKRATISTTLLILAVVLARAQDYGARLTRDRSFWSAAAGETLLTDQYVAVGDTSVSRTESMGHGITFGGISGCDINLERIAGSNGVGLSQTWKATAVGNGCPTDPVYQFSLAHDEETEFAMKRDFAAKGGDVDSLTRTKWTWTPMTPGDYRVRVVLKATYGSPDSERVEIVANPISIPVPFLDVPRPLSHPLVAVYTTHHHHCQTLQVRFRDSR